jgi:hypothetical protein
MCGDVVGGIAFVFSHYDVIVLRNRMRMLSVVLSNGCCCLRNRFVATNIGG